MGEERTGSPSGHGAAWPSCAQRSFHTPPQRPPTCILERRQLAPQRQAIAGDAHGTHARQLAQLPRQLHQVCRWGPGVCAGVCAGVHTCAGKRGRGSTPRAIARRQSRGQRREARDQRRFQARQRPEAHLAAASAPHPSAGSCPRPRPQTGAPAGQFHSGGSSSGVRAGPASAAAAAAAGCHASPRCRASWGLRSPIISSATMGPSRGAAHSPRASLLRC